MLSPAPTMAVDYLLQSFADRSSERPARTRILAHPFMGIDLAAIAQIISEHNPLCYITLPARVDKAPDQVNPSSLGRLSEHAGRASYGSSALPFPTIPDKTRTRQCSHCLH